MNSYILDHLDYYHICCLWLHCHIKSNVGARYAVESILQINNHFDYKTIKSGSVYVY